MYGLLRKMILATSLVTVSPVAFGADSPSATVVDNKILENRFELTFDGTSITGPGAEHLVSNAKKARFVLMGEDHGFSEVPAFTQALWRAIGPTTSDALVLEIGPYSGTTVESAMRQGDLAFSKLVSRHPYAVPFLAWKADAGLAKAFVNETKQPSIWGIDQEFILSTSLHFEQLVKTAPTRSARKLAQSYLDESNKIYRSMIRHHDPSECLLMKLKDNDFQALRSEFGASASGVISALEDSQRIYRGQGSDPYASNMDRSTLMKKNFMAKYHDYLRNNTNSLSHVVFRMGAFHMSRGLSPTGQYDIGNMVAALADSEGALSYHVLVVPASGEVNRYLPFMDSLDAKATPYNAHAELDDLGAGTLIDHSYASSWTFYDMESLRKDPSIFNANTSLKYLAFAYDAVVIIPRAHSAEITAGSPRS